MGFQFSVTRDWEVVFENRSDPPYWNPLRAGGPRGPQARPGITITTAVVKDVTSSDAYMTKAESDLRKIFNDFSLLRKWQEPVLGAPAAWMSYTYRGNHVPMQELNVTAFFGSGPSLWFQFICETSKKQASHDFPVFKAIIESLYVHHYGIRLPYMKLAGVLILRDLRTTIQWRGKTEHHFSP